MNGGTQGAGGIARAVKWIGVLAVVLTAGGVAWAEDKPQRNAEIEAILKKLPDGQHKFLPDSGSYEFMWEDAGGKTRRGCWFVAGSPVTKGQAAGSTTLLFVQSHGTDPQPVAAELKRVHDLKSDSLGDDKRAVVGVSFLVPKVSDAADFATFSGNVFMKVDRAIESAARAKAADAKGGEEKGVVAPPGGVKVAPPGGGEASLRTRLANLRTAEKRLTNEVAQCEKNEQYWQKIFDESCLPGRTLNASAATYVTSWLGKKLSAQQKLGQVQDEIVDVEQQLDK